MKRDAQMKATEILVKEHMLILQGLNNLSLAKEKLEKGERPPREFFEKAVDFSRNFSDKFHHFKEEYLMFGLLAQKKDGEIDLEIGALRYQHERGREFIGKIENAIEGYSMGNEIATTTLLENLASYISLLRRHIYNEDHVFFKMAEKELTDDENKALLVQFKAEELKFEDLDFLESSRKLVKEIEALIGA
jgi:hemerythrin-like domain-containing protein